MWFTVLRVSSHTWYLCNSSREQKRKIDLNCNYYCGGMAVEGGVTVGVV